MKIRYYNVPLIDRMHISKVLRCALQHLHQPTNVELELQYMSQEEIHQLNNSTRGIDRATDVLSYPYLDIVAGQIVSDIQQPQYGNNIMLGSVALCRQIATQQAKQYGHSVTREVCYLSLHALLHCLGYDHIQPQDEQIMTTVAQQIMNKAKVNR